MLLFAIPINIASIYRYKYKCAWEKVEKKICTGKKWRRTRALLLLATISYCKTETIEGNGRAEQLELHPINVRGNEKFTENTVVVWYSFLCNHWFYFAFCSLPCMLAKMRISFKCGKKDKKKQQPPREKRHDDEENILKIKRHKMYDDENWRIFTALSVNDNESTHEFGPFESDLKLRLLEAIPKNAENQSKSYGKMLQMRFFSPCALWMNSILQLWFLLF